jgi:predicted phage terminase large subunit-like protein
MYTLPSLPDIELEEERRRLIRSFPAYSRAAWPIVEPGTPLVWNWHLDAIGEHLQAVYRGEIRQLLVNVPPGHQKSLQTCVFWPTWIWAQKPEWRGVFSSYASQLAIRDSVKCRLILESDWYKRRFVRGKWELSGDQNVKAYYQNTRMGFRLATSVDGAGTGHRGSAIVVDDPLKAGDAHSKAARDEVLRWWDQEMANRLSDPRTGVRVVIMQRLHSEDLAGHILDQGGWEHLCLPSRFEPKRRSVTYGQHPERAKFWEDPRKKEGELLFPEMFSAEVIAAEERRLGSVGFPGQHQQRPTASEGGMFKASWWRFWRHAWEDDVDDPYLGDLRSRTIVLPDKFDEFSLSWDCAFKDTKDSDFVAGGVWAKKSAERFLLDLDWRRMDFPETLRAFQAQVTKWPKATAKLVEDKANGPAVIATLKSKIHGIIAVNPQGGKEARAAATSPQVEAGNVYLPLHAPWRDRYIGEHKDFPLGAHDDAVDQQSQQLLRWLGSGNLDFLTTMGKR